MDQQNISERNDNRSRKPRSQAFRAFMATGWADPPDGDSGRLDSADHAARRRAALGAGFPGDRLVIPAGAFKTRANDSDYAFRPHSAFAHLTGLGADQEPDAVLVLHPLESPEAADGGTVAAGAAGAREPVPAHEAVLYIRPAAGKDTPEFYSDARYGEFWVGRRPTLAEIAAQTGIRTEHLDSLRDALAKDAGPGQVSLRVIAETDAAVTAMVAEVRSEAGLGAPGADAGEDGLTPDQKLAEAASELRLVKDEWEIGQMRVAIAATVSGFERVVRALPAASAAARGERAVEAAFEAGARVDGNGPGYETIAASGPHATTLHWIRNSGPVRTGDLLLLDAGVEADSLYTADITRTIPVSGRYTDIQRRVWEAVVDAADAAFAAARPGNRFRDVHDAAMAVVAQRLEQWGLLPVAAAEALAPQGQQHRRWMVHGTSHHLGLDVHDCAQARAELYVDAVLRPGMVFTIEPGLYFKPEDLTVPPEYRGIGARCEDDILITADGAENLSAALPRRADAIEAWMAALQDPGATAGPQSAVG
ncbi:MAG: aminopeptidase P family protein [Bifidobacteriaceae bacterium]|jgi:Xaa-Pro aminopeptidase|nr:aminopeptidase P family protein [Bifidobacteriaceae bacterium]